MFFIVAFVSFHNAQKMSLAQEKRRRTFVSSSLLRLFTKKIHVVMSTPVTIKIKNGTVRIANPR